MKEGDLKRKLRELKKLEKQLRCKCFAQVKEEELTWNEFFSTKENMDVKYPFNILVEMDHESRSKIFEEYFYNIYYQIYKKNPFIINNIYNPELLSIMGLSINADITEIKKRFKELSKKYHPDHGGDKEKMIELLETYNKLIDENKR
jgi:preprotein translocase subunit Sec63